MTTRKTTTRSRTSKTGTTARKRTTTTKKPATKTAVPPATKTTAPAQDTQPQTVVTQETAVVEQPGMNKKELIERAVARCGVKKRDAKPAIEAALAVIGEALADGRDLNLPLLGKVKINRTKQRDNGQVIVARIRQPSSPANTESDTDSYIEAAE